jgi:RimJ/RimL family protein N-acetyltransferase
MITLDQLLASDAVENEFVDPHRAPRPAPIVLEGQYAKLIPLQGEHADELYEPSHGPDREDLWRFLSDGPYEGLEDFRAAIERKASSEDALFFAIIDHASGKVSGYASYMRIDPVNRCLEVGNILFTPALQKTRGATEAMYLMARHAFEDLGYRRYEWKCNSLNRPSIRAALRLGFRFEGVFEQHMIVKARNRDTAWFAMLDRDWPERRAAFDRWLAPENFDSSGRQISPLRP